jgi:hypothetical protein
MAGLPLSSWLLIVCSVAIGLAIELTFWTRRRWAPRDGSGG